MKASGFGWGILTIVTVAAPLGIPASGHAASPATTQSASPNLRVTWRHALPQPTEAAAGSDGQIAVLGARDGTIHAVNVADGKLLWESKLADAVTSGPGFAPLAVFLGDEAGVLHALSRADGKPLWTFKTGGRIVGRPAVASDRVLVGSYDNCLYCLDLTSGKELWKFKTNAQVHAGALVAGDLVITGGCDGQLRGIALADGTQRWSADLEGAIATTPASLGSSLFVATMSGTAAAVDLAGKTLWSVKPVADGGTFTVSPAILGDRVAFADDQGQVVFLSVAEGKQLATAKLSGKSPLAAAGGYLAAGTEEGQLIFLDPATGEIVRKATLGGTVLSVVSVPGRLIAATGQGVLWSLVAP